jgi:hypothetical protein
MPKRPKIDLDKVKATLATLCVKCSYEIPPSRGRQFPFSKIGQSLPWATHVELPKIGQAAKPNLRDKTPTLYSSFHF